MKQTLLQIYFNIFKILAKIYLFRNPAYIIWITWSIWKTGCRMIISEILQKNLEDKIVYTSSKNFNWELWMSLSILWISDYKPELSSVIKTLFNAFKVSFLSRKLYDVVVLEYWIDHPWEMKFLLSVVKPNIWIITKIDKVHSLQFSSEEVIASEKYKLVSNSTDLAFLNFDDKYYKKYENNIKNKLFYSTSINDKNIDILGENYSIVKEHDQIKTSFNIYEKGALKANIKTNLIWEENVWYISLGYKILDVLNKHFYKKEFFWKAKKDLEINFTLQPSRFSVFKWINDNLIIDSSYNAAPLSVRKIISNVCDIRKNFYPEFKKIFCLWEMRELWDFAKKEHEDLAEFVKDKTDYVFLVWESMEKYFMPEILKLWFPKERVKHFKNSFMLWEYLKNFLEKSNEKHLLLFKWSQNTIFLEEAIKYILKHKDDEKRLCRQDNYWLDKKSK